MSLLPHPQVCSALWKLKPYIPETSVWHPCVKWGSGQGWNCFILQRGIISGTVTISPLPQLPDEKHPKLRTPLAVGWCRGTALVSLELLPPRAAFGSDASKTDKAMAPGAPCTAHSWRLLHLKMSSEELRALHHPWSCGSSNSAPPELAAKCNHHKMTCSKVGSISFPKCLYFLPL